MLGLVKPLKFPAVGPVRKSEAEQAIRHLCHVWRDELGFRRAAVSSPNFAAFTAWLHDKGHGQYLSFRSVLGPLDDVERWFDEEFKQRRRTDF